MLRKGIGYEEQIELVTFLREEKERLVPFFKGIHYKKVLHDVTTYINSISLLVFPYLKKYIHKHYDMGDTVG